MYKVTAEQLESFFQEHKLDTWSTFAVTERCIEVYIDGQFKHFIDGSWYVGRMPEGRTLTEQERLTGKILGRYIKRRSTGWHNEEGQIK